MLDVNDMHVAFIEGINVGIRNSTEVVFHGKKWEDLPSNNEEWEKSVSKQHAEHYVEITDE